MLLTVLNDMSLTDGESNSLLVVDHNTQVERVIEDYDWMFKLARNNLAQYQLDLTSFSIDVVENQLSVKFMFSNETLNGNEIACVRQYWLGQLSDGWGECIQQQPVLKSEVDVVDDCYECEDGEIMLDDDEYESCDRCNGLGFIDTTELAEFYLNFDLDNCSVVLN